MLRKEVKKTKAKIFEEKPTVNKIIEAAIPLFATKGVAAVSVKELADAAGVNVALISYYFGGKDNLYACVLEKQLAILEETINTISKEEISPASKIKRFADSTVITYKENPYIERLFFIEMLNPTKYFDSVVKIAVHRLYCFLHDCICDAVDSGEFKSDVRPDLAAICLMKILNVSLMAQQCCKDILPAGDNFANHYMEQAISIYLNGITK